MAGSTSTSVSYSGRGWAVEISWTADATDGSVPDTEIIAAMKSAMVTYGHPEAVSGWVERVVTSPGTPAPTDDYDITLEDPEGVDVLGGAGSNRDTATSEQVLPLVDGVPAPAYLASPSSLTLKLSGNSVASAQGKVVIHVSR